MKTSSLKIILLTGIFLFFTQNAFAYIDPGSGSLIIQVILGFCLGALYVLKIYWTRLKAVIKKLFNKRK